MKNLLAVILVFVTTSLVAQNVWVDLSSGPSLTRDDLFAFGPGISVGWTTKHDRLFKIKASYHRALQILTRFPQQSVDLNLMRGLVVYLERSTLEFYYGLGVIAGHRNIDDRKLEFVTPGIPLEARIQGRVFGIGADANLNFQMPYFGLKIFGRIPVVK